MTATKIYFSVIRTGKCLESKIDLYIFKNYGIFFF